MSVIGLIGTGVMGSGMGSNLLKAGYKLLVYNRTAEKTAALVEQGAVLKASVAELASSADIVITMVGLPKDVEEIYFGSDGILDNMKSGSFAVDMTTSSPKLAKKIYDAAKEKNIRALDAPVSGGDIGARDGTLSIMVGGDEDAYKELLPVFSAMGKNIVLQGGAGAGQQTKMCNQICIAANIMGVCEMLSYAEKSGLDRNKVLKTLQGGGAASWQLSAYTPRILKEDYTPGFYIKHFVKDMRIALEEADSMNLDLPALNLSDSLFEKLMDQDLGNLGTQALYQLYSGSKE